MKIIAYEMKFFSKTVQHVAKWNEKALKLYLDNGFKASRIEKIR